MKFNRVKAYTILQPPRTLELRLPEELLLQVTYFPPILRALLLHIRLWLRRTLVGVHQRVLVGTQACLYQDRHLVHLHQVHDRKV
jgi:hypothetical protein